MPFSRQEQLDSTSEELKRHHGLGTQISEAMRRYSEQTSQLTGVYEEVDKLSKGRSVLPTSDLHVEFVNNLISDSKALVFGDTYLDRLSIFVPAGDNPSYPELLLALRVVQQTLKRFDTMLKVEAAKHSSIVMELETISAALRIAQREEEEGAADANTLDDVTEDQDELESEDAENEDEDAGDYDQDEEDSSGLQEFVQKNDVKRLMGMEVTLDSLLDNQDRKPYDRWFKRLHDGEYYFDFVMLDRLGLPKYESPSTGITFMKAAE